MNCLELQRELPEIMEGSRSAEQEAHLRSCSACSGLVSDLNVISQEARMLRASEEPSPRVWNSIEIALRQEGLIRQPLREPFLVPTSSRRWRPGWMLPVAAVFLAVLGVLVYERGPAPQIAEQRSSERTDTASVRTSRTNASEDLQLLEVVGTRVPSMRASYASNLQNVNAYIRDAEASVQSDPNDEEAQQSLMDAYDQRAMVYEMAVDRSLP